MLIQNLDKSFKSFSDALKNINILLLQLTINMCNKRKIEADLRGYDSVIDYLLHDQVTREMYDRQIDVIMSDLAPVMQNMLNYYNVYTV